MVLSKGHNVLPDDGECDSETCRRNKRNVCNEKNIVDLGGIMKGCGPNVQAADGSSILGSTAIVVATYLLTNTERRLHKLTNCM